MSKRKSPGYWSNMSDEQLISYIEQNYKGNTIKELVETKEVAAYNIARKRGLIDTLVEKEILIRGRKSRGFYKNMSDERLISYIEQNYKGNTLVELKKSKAEVAYNIACKRGLIDTLVGKGILIRECRPSGFFKNMSDEQLISFVEQNYKGNTITELAKTKDGAAYNVACKRGLIEGLVEKGILIRTKNRQGDSIGILETILEGDAT